MSEGKFMKDNKIAKCVLNGEEKLGSLSNTNPINYVEKKEYLDEAEKIDKMDMFDHLAIDDYDYGQREYLVDNKIKTVGIKIDNAIHYTGCPILPHQKNAVKKFLGDFRGVGILADEVGMGKTVEAGMVVCELAERNLASSILIVSASDDNCNDWEYTMSVFFGMVGLVRVHNSREIRDNCEKQIPSVPLIITFADFCKIHKDEFQNVLFDVIVFDEAHNMDNSDIGKIGMSNLRTLMATKKVRNKPYCILVSGTPHKGNLDSMFPLWYFIKGGNDEEIAREHYKKFLCHEASTIAEFVESYKISELNKDMEFLKFMNSKRDLLKDEDPVNWAQNFKLFEYHYRDEFIKDKGNKVKIAEINKITREAYKNLIDCFMIRQSRKCNQGRFVSKRASNYFFAPVNKTGGSKVIEFNNYENPQFTDLSCNFSFDLNDIYGPKAILYRDQYKTIEEFVRGMVRSNVLKDDAELNRLKNQLIFESLEQLDGFYDKFDDHGKRRIIDGKYYLDSVGNYYKHDIKNYFGIVDETETDLFTLKAEKLAQIIMDPSRLNEKMIIFFDYYNIDKSDENARLYEYYKEKYPKIYERIIFSDDDGYAADVFSAKKSNPNERETLQAKSGLLFSSEPLSESSNFQFCHLAVNFSICYSPIKMDQRIGRIDRIGQENNMEVISFATMETLEGYLLAFFNQIQIFSGWKDDIILVTGCDNKNTSTMRCLECGKIVRSFDGSTSCPNCATIDSLRPLVNAYSYKCPSCSYKFMRMATGSKTEGHSYVCSRNKKLTEHNNDRRLGIDNTFYICNKKCSILHCRRAEKVECAVYAELKNDYNTDINVLRKLCNNCTNKICDTCHIMIDTLGTDIVTKEHMGQSCIECPSKNALCTTKVNINSPICEMCHSELEPIVPATFDEFAEFIWNEPTFVSDFSFEVRKISEVVNVLREEDK